MSKLNLLGEIFGRLTVVEDVGRDKHRQVLWRCVCSCGSNKDVIATAAALRRGSYTSCGCRKRKDLTGKKFNHLTAMYPINNGSRRVTWHWKCDCGNEVDILGI